MTDYISYHYNIVYLNNEKQNRALWKYQLYQYQFSNLVENEDGKKLL